MAPCSRRAARLRPGARRPAGRRSPSRPPATPEAPLPRLPQEGGRRVRGDAEGQAPPPAPARRDTRSSAARACHGPGKQHAESGGEERGALIYFSKKTKTPVAERNAACLQCHEKTARTLWKGSAHESRNVACTDCHTLMHPESERANLKKANVWRRAARCHAQQKAQHDALLAHAARAGEDGVHVSCHNPHGSPNEKLLIATSTNETCYTCHAEKRGPFLWEHAPVVENCANCHDSHGSAHEKMLKVSRPRLCQQCHASSGHPHRAARHDAPGRRAVRVQPPVLHLPLQHPRLKPSRTVRISTGSMLPTRRETMKHISCGAAMLLAAGAFALARPTTVHAQSQDTTKATGVDLGVEAGVRQFDPLFSIIPHEEQLGKLLEYRDLKQGSRDPAGRADLHAEGQYRHVPDRRAQPAADGPEHVRAREPAGRVRRAAPLRRHRAHVLHRRALARHVRQRKPVRAAVAAAGLERVACRAYRRADPLDLGSAQDVGRADAVTRMGLQGGVHAHRQDGRPSDGHGVRRIVEQHARNPRADRPDGAGLPGDAGVHEAALHGGGVVRLLDVPERVQLGELEQSAADRRTSSRPARRSAARRLRRTTRRRRPSRARRELPVAHARDGERLVFVVAAGRSRSFPSRRTATTSTIRDSRCRVRACRVWRGRR